MIMRVYLMLEKYLDFGFIKVLVSEHEDSCLAGDDADKSQAGSFRKSSSSLESCSRSTSSSFKLVSSSTLGILSEN